MFILCHIIAFGLFATSAYAQTPSSPELPARIDIGNGFSVVAPIGPDWQITGTPASYFKLLGPDDHSLALIATTGPSGITRQEILAVSGPNGANQVVKLVARFVERAWKAHAGGLQDGRFEAIETVNETGGNYSFGKFFCGYSRIVVRDRGALVDGVPTRLRYVAYSCVEFPDMTVAASVSYSERGREQDLTDSALAEGERFARSLERRQ
jgi:hypothetical protein